MQYSLLIFCTLLVFLQFMVLLSFSDIVDDQIPIPAYPSQCLNISCGRRFDPYSPLVNCSYLPEDFHECEEPVNHDGNATSKAELGYGCLKWGGQQYEAVERTRVWCRVLDGIQCYGDREFLSLNQYPCVKYTGHYFISTLLYSLFLGCFGADRFCLGHTGTAVGKFLTLGGVGVWWIVDIILLILGDLRPADDSNWEPIKW